MATLAEVLERDGRLPPVRLQVTPLEKGREELELDTFFGYHFSRSVVVPVSSFSFDFAPPEDDPLDKFIREGDIVTLFANDKQLAAGIVDQTDQETDAITGERASLSGRDLVGQLEDHDAVSLDAEPIWATKTTIDGIMSRLIENTRISTVRKQGFPDGKKDLFATEPGESKLAALQRHLESLNALIWADSDGSVIIGQPDFKQEAKGELYLRAKDRDSNVLSMRVTRASATIPNVVVPLWAGMETVPTAGQAMYNKAAGPNRMRQQGHQLVRLAITSDIDANNASGLANLNRLIDSGGADNLLVANAARMLARENMHELIVQAVVPGHYNEDGDPFEPDQVYHINYDRGGVDEDLYLFACEYSLGQDRGQTTTLHFCKLGTIVAGAEAP